MSVRVLARMPLLMLKLAFTALRFKRRVKASASRLRRSMIRNGMDKETARKLADMYAESFSIRNMLAAVGAGGSQGGVPPFGR